LAIEFPRHHWRGSIEAADAPFQHSRTDCGFRAIIGAAPLKRPITVLAQRAVPEGFRAIIGAAPLKLDDLGNEPVKSCVSAPSLARLH